MSPVGSISNNNVSNFNQIDNTPKSNPATSQQKVSSSNINKTENASPEQLGKGLQDVKSGTKSANEAVKTGNEIVKGAVIGIKGNTEQISKKLEVFLPEEKTFRSLKDDISKLDFGSKTIKQGLDTIKNGVQSFEKTINNGKDTFEKLVIGVGIPASKLNQAESKADVSIRITNFGLRSAELGAGQVQQGIQTIELGTKFLGSNQEKGKELIKNGVDTVNRGVDRLAREASQSAKNIDDAATSVVHAANDAAKAIGRELPEESILESQHPANSQAYSDSIDHPITDSRQSYDSFNGCPPILVKDPSNQNNTTNSTDKINISDPIIQDPSNPTVNPDNTTVKDPSNPDSVTTGGTSKTDPPPPINRENLSTTDKLVIDTLGLDKLEPGEKKTIGASALGKFGAGLYAGLGGSAKLSIERDKTDPNKFNITVELEPKVEGGLDGTALGEGLGAKASFSKKAVVNLQADFSKKGEATEFAAFAAQAGLAATLPAIAAPLLIAENIPGVNLPGEPVDYVRSRIKSIEVGAGLSTEISGQLVAGLGIESSLANSLSGGGRLDFNDNGTYTITTNLTLGVKGEANVLVGGPGAVVSVPGLGEELNVSLEGSTTVDKTGKALSSDSRIKLSTRLQVGNAGKEFELSISVKDLIKQVPPEVGARLAEAVSRGDSFTAAKIFQTEILPKFNVSFDYKSRTFTNDKAAIKADGSISGFGVEGSVEFASEKTIATEESKATVSIAGITVEREIEENGVKRKVNKNLTFSDLKKEASNLVSNTTQNLQDTTNKTIKPRKTLNILNRGLLGNLLG